MIQYHSPCISVCAIDESGTYCIGCKRTKQEIGGWMCYTEDERLRLTEELKTREYDQEGNIRDTGPQAT